MALPKTLALVIAATIVLSAFAGVAGAATPTSPAGTTYEGKLHATSEGHVTIQNPILNIECASTLEGEVKEHGGGEAIRIPLSSLTFTGCTNNWHVTTVLPGTLEVHAIAGSKNGTVTWSGGTVEATRFASVTCRYKAEATDIGTLTGSKATGGTATIDLNGKLPLHSGSSFLCGEGSNSLTGSYSLPTPDYLDVDAVFGPIPTSPAGSAYEGKLHATSEGHVTIHNSITNIQCNSTLEGEVESPGGGEPIRLPLSSLNFSSCTGGWEATVNTPGTLEVHAIAGSKNGTITWSGATISFTRFGSINCLYKTEATDIGTLTGSKATGGTATIDLSGVLLRHSGSSFLCGGETAQFTGSYKVATPDYLDVDAVFGPIPTSPAGSAYEGKVHASSEGHVTIHNSIVNIECASTLEGEVEAPGGGDPIAIPLSSLTFTGCTNNWTVTVNAPGKLEVHPIAGSKNGTVTWTGATVTFNRFGYSCVYKTEATHVGTLTASKATGATATIDLSGALIRHASGFLCGGETAKFTGSYKVETPDYLDVDAEVG